MCNTLKFVLLLVSSVLLFSQTGCKSKAGEEQKLFSLIDPEHSGIEFINTIPENDTLNQFIYHYIFNGAGVATGDLNNDGLPDLVLTANEKPAAIYLNKGDFKFEDITGKSGVQTSGWMSGVTMADVNNDGWLDFYICKSGPEKGKNARVNYLFINNKNLTFTEKANEWGVADPGNATNATFFDMDNDGDLDLYLGNHADRFFGEVNVPFHRTLRMDYHNQQHLYRNDGNKFTDISTESGTIAMGYCLSATAADFNRDGFTDLYVCNDYHIPDYYYINNGDGTFTESFQKYFKHSSTNSMGSDFADYNNDGWLDLVTMDMLSEDPRRFQLMAGPKDLDFFQVALKNGYGYQYMRNALQTNSGNGHFSDYAYLTGIARTDWSWSPLFADFDNDGYVDLFVSNGYYRDVTNMDFMMFQDRKFKQTGKTTLHKEIIEKLPFEKIPNYMYRNNGNYRFENVAESWGLDMPTHSTGAAYADFNNDGQLDLIVCNQGENIQLYKNNGTKSNYLKLTFKGGTKNNSFGYGCKVIAKTSKEERIYEVQASHGYQSSSEPNLNIGLGTEKSVLRLTVIWPNGEFQELNNVQVNQKLELNEKNASGKYTFDNQENYTFEQIADKLGLNFTHQEKDNPDFKREPLLPHRFTKLGPGMASGDVNGDGLADLLITNAREGSGCQLFVQKPDGTFQKSAKQPWTSMNDVDILGCLIFDADGDDDQDIYLVAGGSEYEWPSPKYEHRLFINNGKGDFTLNPTALPNVNCSGSCITAGDFDSDGDLDLFVGGRLMPGKYPNLDIRSYLLRNDGGVFKDVTQFIAPELVKPGMICAAVFADFNNDNKLDLVVAGEWMPVVFLQNTGDKFVVHRASGTMENSGWFNSLLPVDIDNDGDLDFVAGNKGENSFVQARMENPLKIYWADLDGNQVQDLWMTYTREGKEYPLYQLDEMGKAFPGFISKKFTTYTEYAGKSAEEIFGAENMAKNRLKASSFSSVIMINNGGGSFEIKELPRLCQSGPVFGLACADLDGNGFMDIIGTGNSFSPRVTHGRDDALNGFVLYNNAGNLTFSDGLKNGFKVQDDAKSLVLLNWKKNAMLIAAARNNSQLLVFNPKNQSKFLPSKSSDQKAIVKLKSGKTRVENLSYGHGYLSCSQPGVWINDQVVSVQFIDSKGKIRQEWKK